MTKILLTLFTALATVTLTAQPPKGYAPGDAVAPFSLRNTDESMVSLSDYKKAKGFIVVFTCNECPYAKAYQDRILALNSRYNSQGFPVLAINANDGNAADSYEKMQVRAKDKKYTFPYLTDPDQTVTKQFGATNTPHSFVIEQKAGSYLLRYSGAIDNDTEDANPQKTRFVEDAVNALLAQKEITTSKTKAIGCGIKWKKG